jgi:hypothetical protein
MLGLSGCGDEAAAPPANGPAASAPSKPAADKALAPAPTPSESKNNDAPPLEPPKTGAVGAEANMKTVSLTEGELAKIRKLPAAEQDAAIKQSVCPVSGQHLGKMGTPYKIMAADRTFYLCCESCAPEVTKDPKAIIAKLDGK